MGIDIEKLTHDETKLYLTEVINRLNSFYENNYLMILIIDPQTGVIQDCNYAASRYYGYSKEEIRGKKIFEINMLNPHEISKKMQEAQSKIRTNFQFKHRLKSGEIRDVEVFSGPIKFNDKNLLYSVIHDITEKVELQKKLLESESRYKNVVENSPSAIMLIRDNVIYLANKRARQMLCEQEAQELIGINFCSLIHSEQKNEICRIISTLESNEKILLELSLITTQKKVVLTEAVFIALEDEQGRATQVILRDITQLKRNVHLASVFQHKMLELEFPLPEYAKLCSIYEAAEFVSGDFYHFYKCSEHTVVGILGDVSGKGVSAALINTAIKVMFFEKLQKTNAPNEILDLLSKDIISHFPDEHIAACCFKLDFANQLLTFSSGGINEFIYVKSKILHRKTLPNPFLGMFYDYNFAQVTYPFAKGERFWFFTDGLEEFLEQIETQGLLQSSPELEDERELILKGLGLNGQNKDDATWIGLEIL